MAAARRSIELSPAIDLTPGQVFPVVVVPRDSGGSRRDRQVDTAVRIQPFEGAAGGADDTVQTARPVRVRRRVEQGRPCGDPDGVGIPVGARLADRSDRAPPSVEVLGFPDGADRIGNAQIDRGKEARAVAAVSYTHLTLPTTERV